MLPVNAIKFTRSGAQGSAVYHTFTSEEMPEILSLYTKWFASQSSTSIRRPLVWRKRQAFESSYGWDAIADTFKFAVCYPNGYANGDTGILPMKTNPILN